MHLETVMSSMLRVASRPIRPCARQSVVLDKKSYRMESCERPAEYYDVAKHNAPRLHEPLVSAGLRLFIVILVLSLTAVYTPQLHAQTGDASLSGTIVDRQGGLVPDVEVSVVNTDTGVAFKTKTNAAGVYNAPFLKAGHYRILVTKEGFKQIDVRDITLNVQDSVNQNFTLDLGGTSETVIVYAEALNVNTTDASVSTVIDRQFAENLPLNGRSFQSLIYLTPGVTLNMGAGATIGWSLGQFSVNGQRASSNYWMVDGVSANIGTTPWRTPTAAAAGGLGAFNVLGGTNSLVSVDALQEFRIQTSTYAPEFGRTPGGQISIVTRSGTNQFHGTAFDYLRNDVMDATDWFASAHSVPKAAARQNDFGGAFAGRLIRDKTFFFFSYEGLRLRQPVTVLTTVPDLAARQNAIPAVQPFINAYPQPNPGAADVGPGIAPFNASFSNPATVNAYSLRIDHALAKSLNLFARYNYSPSKLTTRTAGGTTANTVFAVNSTTKTATVGATWTKSSQTVNDVRFNYSTSGGQTLDHMDTFGGGAVPPGASLIPSPLTFQNAIFAFFPLFGTDMQLFQGRNAGNLQHQYNVVDTLSVQKGSHSLKFGVDYRRLSPFFNPRSYGLLVLFLDMASVKAGTPFDTYTETITGATFLFHNLGVFAQDSWRVSPRLTLTYGLRWDVDFRPSTKNGPVLPAVTGFSLTDLSNLALAPTGTPIYNTRYGNVAPRVGVAYQIPRRADWGLVLRSGFGVFYDLSSTEVGDFNTGAYPYQSSLDTVAPFPTPAAVAAAPPVVPPNATQGKLVGFDPHLNLPYSLQWSFALEQSLGKAQAITVSYIGSSGRRLLTDEAVTRPNPNYRTTQLVSNAGISNYNALHVQFQRRLSGGLQALASYSWAHSIDTGSYGEYANGSFANIKANRADSDFDIRDTFSGALTYDVPALGRNAFAKAITRGWATQNIIQIHSAPPVDIIDGAFTYLSTQNSQIEIRPDVVAGQPLYLSGPQYPGGKAVNPNAFSNPPVSPTTGNPLRQGNLGRNALRAFGLTQWDFAIQRDFPIHDAFKLQFRAEMFNILNHPNFAPYNSSFNQGDPYFGQSTQMLGQGTSGAVEGGGGLNALYQIGSPRSIQLALKLTF